MVSQGMIKFNRWASLIVGGIVGIGLLIGTIVSLIKGNGFPPIQSIFLMLICVSAAILGFKEIRRLKHR